MYTCFRSILLFIFVNHLLTSVLAFDERNFLPSYWEWYCGHQHADRFLFEANITSDACQVECVFLDSSSPKYSRYFDTPFVVYYKLEDGRPCRKHHVCHNGKCTLLDDLNDINEKGFVVIRNISAKVPDKDTVTATDTFLKIYLRHIQDNAEDTLIGLTKVIENNNYPSFKESFVSPTVDRSSVVIIVIYDSDGFNSDDHISTVYVPIKSSRKKMTRLFPGGWITFDLIWISDDHGPS